MRILKPSLWTHRPLGQFAAIYLGCRSLRDRRPGLRLRVRHPFGQSLPPSARIPGSSSRFLQGPYEWPIGRPEAVPESITVDAEYLPSQANTAPVAELLPHLATGQHQPSARVRSSRTAVKAKESVTGRASGQVRQSAEVTESSSINLKQPPTLSSGGSRKPAALLAINGSDREVFPLGDSTLETSGKPFTPVPSQPSQEVETTPSDTAFEHVPLQLPAGSKAKDRTAGGALKPALELPEADVLPSAEPTQLSVPNPRTLETLAEPSHVCRSDRDSLAPESPLPQVSRKLPIRKPMRSSRRLGTDPLPTESTGFSQARTKSGSQTGARIRDAARESWHQPQELSETPTFASRESEWAHAPDRQDLTEPVERPILRTDDRGSLAPAGLLPQSSEVPETTASKVSERAPEIAETATSPTEEPARLPNSDPEDSTETLALPVALSGESESPAMVDSPLHLASKLPPPGPAPQSQGTRATFSSTSPQSSRLQAKPEAQIGIEAEESPASKVPRRSPGLSQEAPFPSVAPAQFSTQDLEEAVELTELSTAQRSDREGRRASDNPLLQSSDQPPAPDLTLQSRETATSLAIVPSDRNPSTSSGSQQDKATPTIDLKQPDRRDALNIRETKPAIAFNARTETSVADFATDIPIIQTKSRPMAPQSRLEPETLPEASHARVSESGLAESSNLERPISNSRSGVVGTEASIALASTNPEVGLFDGRGKLTSQDARATGAVVPTSPGTHQTSSVTAPPAVGRTTPRPPSAPGEPAEIALQRVADALDGDETTGSSPGKSKTKLQASPQASPELGKRQSTEPAATTVGPVEPLSAALTSERLLSGPQASPGKLRLGQAIVSPASAGGGDPSVNISPGSPSRPSDRHPLAAPGKSPQGYAVGGRVRDTVSPSSEEIAPSDTIPAMLTPGEFVINARDTQKNLPLLEHINRGGAAEEARPLQRKLASAQPSPTPDIPADARTGKSQEAPHIHSTPAGESLPIAHRKMIQPSRLLGQYRGIGVAAPASAPVQTEIYRVPARTPPPTYSPVPPAFSKVTHSARPSSGREVPPQWGSLEELVGGSGPSMGMDRSVPTPSQRRITGPGPAAATTQQPEAIAETLERADVRAESDADDESVELLAREIYRRLQERLAIERERHGLHPRRLSW